MLALSKVSSIDFDAFELFAVQVEHKLVEVLASEEEVWRLIQFLGY
jgi:hypothetical protein